MRPPALSIRLLRWGRGARRRDTLHVRCMDDLGELGRIGIRSATLAGRYNSAVRGSKAIGHAAELYEPPPPHERGAGQGSATPELTPARQDTPPTRRARMRRKWFLTPIYSATQDPTVDFSRSASPRQTSTYTACLECALPVP